MRKMTSCAMWRGAVGKAESTLMFLPERCNPAEQPENLENVRKALQVVLLGQLAKS